FDLGYRLQPATRLFSVPMKTTESRHIQQLPNRKGPNGEPALPIVPNFGLMRLPQVLALYLVGKSTWWAGVKSGRFPQPVKLGSRITAWHVQDILALIQSHHADNSRGQRNGNE